MGDIFRSEDVVKLLAGKYLKIIGASNERSVYKDLITLSQQTRFIKTYVCKKKGEFSCANDSLLEGGRKAGMELSNGIDYREKRLYKSQTTQIKIGFEFITRVWNDHVEQIVNGLKTEKPDVLVMNSTLWDMSRYNIINEVAPSSIDEFKRRLVLLLDAVKENVDEETLVIWVAGLPVGHNPNGAILDPFLPSSSSIAAQLHLHVVAANNFVKREVDVRGFDFLDTHFFMRHQLHRQVRDETHWDNTGLRRIVNVLLTHISEAWGVPLPGLWKELVENHVDENQNSFEQNPLDDDVVGEGEINGDDGPTSKIHRLSPETPPSVSIPTTPNSTSLTSSSATPFSATSDPSSATPTSSSFVTLVSSTDTLTFSSSATTTLSPATSPSSSVTLSPSATPTSSSATPTSSSATPTSSSATPTLPNLFFTGWGPRNDAASYSDFNTASIEPAPILQKLASPFRPASPGEMIRTWGGAGAFFTTPIFRCQFPGRPRLRGRLQGAAPATAAGTAAAAPRSRFPTPSSMRGGTEAARGNRGEPWKEPLQGPLPHGPLPPPQGSPPPKGSSPPKGSPPPPQGPTPPPQGPPPPPQGPPPPKGSMKRPPPPPPQGPPTPPWQGQHQGSPLAQRFPIRNHNAWQQQQAVQQQNIQQMPIPTLQRQRPQFWGPRWNRGSRPPPY